MALTGNQDIDSLILMKLTDYELTKVCQVNKLARKVCNEPMFWRNRLLNRYKIDGREANRLMDYFGFDNLKDLYIFITTLKTPLTYLTILRDTDLIENFINNSLEKIVFPRWVNQQEYIQDVRRNIVENPYTYNTMPSFNVHRSGFGLILPLPEHYKTMLDEERLKEFRRIKSKK